MIEDLNKKNRDLRGSRIDAISEVTRKRMEAFLNDAMMIIITMVP